MLFHCEINGKWQRCLLSVLFHLKCVTETRQTLLFWCTYLLTYLLHLTVSVNCNIQFYYLLTSVGHNHHQNPLCQHTEGWPGDGWLHSTTVYLPKAVIHLTTNRAQHGAPLLINTNPLQLRQTTNMIYKSQQWWQDVPCSKQHWNWL